MDTRTNNEALESYHLFIQQLNSTKSDSEIIAMVNQNPQLLDRKLIEILSVYEKENELEPNNKYAELAQGLQRLLIDKVVRRYMALALEEIQAFVAANTDLLFSITAYEIFDFLKLKHANVENDLFRLEQRLGYLAELVARHWLGIPSGGQIAVLPEYHLFLLHPAAINYLQLFRQAHLQHAEVVDSLLDIMTMLKNRGLEHTMLTLESNQVLYNILNDASISYAEKNAALEAVASKAKSSDPDLWASYQIQLGQLKFTNRVDRSQNIEAAIGHFEDALQIITIDTVPSLWATAMGNLGVVFLERERGEKNTNIEKAISCFQDSLRVFTVDRYPYQWAQTQSNLGLALSKRLQGDPDNNIEQAIAAVEEALKIYTQTAYPKEWAIAMNHLGIAHAKRKGDSTKSQEYYQKSAAQFQDQSKYEWAITQMNLGMSYQNQIDLDSYQQAVIAYQNALTVFTPLTDPKNCAVCASSLGRVFFGIKKLEECQSALMVCHEANEVLRRENQRLFSRVKLGKANADMYQLLIKASFWLQDVVTAFYFSMVKKSRTLTDLIKNPTESLNQLLQSNKGLAESWLPVTKLRTDINELSTALEQSPLIADRKARIQIQQQSMVSLKEKRQQLQQTLDDTLFKFPELYSTEASEPLRPEGAMMLSRELENAPIIEYTYNDVGYYDAFLVTSDGIYYVDLPDALESTVLDILAWLHAYEKEEAWAKDPGTQKKHLGLLHDTLIKPLREYLPNKSQLCISRTDKLHLLPFHLAWDSNSARYLIDDYSIAYFPNLPSVKLLQDAVKTKTYPRSKTVLTVASTAKNSTRPLPNVLAEVEGIASYFAKPPRSVYLHEEAALTKNLIKAVNSKAFDVIHFGCHGVFNSDDPANSGLLLHDGILSVEQIQTEMRLKNWPVVVLSACETGRVLPEAGDEMLGLIPSFLIAGAKSVISSLWAVNDESTAALFKIFYDLQKRYGYHDAEALRQAMLKIRNESKWSEPYYWGAFQVTGYHR